MACRPASRRRSGILVASIYLPNNNSRPGLKFDFKLAWFERLIEHAVTLLAEGVPVVLASVAAEIFFDAQSPEADHGPVT